MLRERLIWNSCGLVFRELIRGDERSKKSQIPFFYFFFLFLRKFVTPSCTLFAYKPSSILFPRGGDNNDKKISIRGSCTRTIRV